MANGLNRVMLIGNLGGDPELRSTTGGTLVCNFSLAVNERKKVDDEWQDVVEWVKIVVWGKSAESCNEYLSKGSQVHVEGRLKTDKWQDKDGNDRWTTSVVAYQVLFLSKAGGGNSDGGGGGGGQQDQGTDPVDSVIPF